MAYSRSLPFGSRSLNYHRGWHITECGVMQASIVFRYKRMRGSCIEKNRCRVAINKERTENDVGILLSFLSRDTVDMATCSGGRLGVEHFPCRLATANSFSRLVGVGLGALTHIVTRFPTLETSHGTGTWRSIVSWTPIGLGRCRLLNRARRLERWPRCEPGWQGGVGYPHAALLRTSTG